MLIAAGSLAHADDNSRKLYKWTDNQGQVHYGDHVPDEYANQERRVFNEQGVEADHVDAQKSPEQMAADDNCRERRRAATGRDQNLLNTYGSVEEIERLRDQRLALLADQIKGRRVSSSRS